MNHARCASYHFGVWSVEPLWFAAAVQAVRSGALVARGNTVEPPADEDGESAGDPWQQYQRFGPVAVIKVDGAIMKVRSKFGGTSSVDARVMIRKAVADDAVSAILLCIDSPGGTIAGTDALARDVAAADARKPVYAHGDDMLASAAYWVACQARRLTATPTSLIGSLGALMALVDSSKAADKEGLEVINLKTGEFKGAGLAGTEITERHRAHYQGIVDTAGEHFKRAVMAGRRLSREQADTLFDGRVHDAADAVPLGLVDEVVPLDQVLARIASDHPLPPEARPLTQSAPAPADSGRGVANAYPAAASHDRSYSYAAQPR